MLKRLRVVRVETTSDNNRRILGLFVPNAAVDTALRGFFLSLSLHPNTFSKEHICTCTCFDGLFSQKKYFPLQFILCSNIKRITICCNHVFQSIT